MHPWRTAAAPTAPSTDPLNQGVHHPLGNALQGLGAGGRVAQLVLQRRLQHRDFQDADATTGTAEAVTEKSWEPAEGLGKALVQRIERPIDRRDQTRSEPVGPVGIEVNLQDVVAAG